MDAEIDQIAEIEVDLQLQVKVGHQPEKEVFDQVEAVGTGALDKVGISVDRLYQVGTGLELEVAVDLDDLKRVSKLRFRVDGSLDCDLPKRMV